MNKAFKKYTGIKYKNTGVGKRHGRKKAFRIAQSASILASACANLSSINSFRLHGAANKTKKAMDAATVYMNSIEAVCKTMKRVDK